MTKTSNNYYFTKTYDINYEFQGIPSVQVELSLLEWKIIYK